MVRGQQEAAVNNKAQDKMARAKVIEDNEMQPNNRVTSREILPFSPVWFLASWIKRAEREEAKAKTREITNAWKAEGGRVLNITVGTRAGFVVVPPLFSSSSSSYSQGSVIRIDAIVKDTTNMVSRWVLDNSAISPICQAQTSIHLQWDWTRKGHESHK